MIPNTMTQKPNEPAPRSTTDKAAKASNTGRISSPASTGGAGTFFEQHVDAYWLAQLLVRGIPPILCDCSVVEVHLQTEHIGWHTDDFLIIGQNGSGEQRKLAGQVKLTFTVSTTDDECRNVVQDFWKDFRNPQLFSAGADHFALVTLRGTNTLLEHFTGLLDCASAAGSEAEFERRLATPGFINAKAVQYCDDIRAIIGEAEDRSVSAADIWPFLRVLHILSLDLNSTTRQTEAMIKTLLAHTTSEQDVIGTAEASWNALLREVGEGMPQARSFQRNDLPEVLRQRHSVVGGAERKALRALSDHSALILGGIRSRIGSKLHLRRGRLMQQVIQKLESTQVVLISGPAGSGKSVIAKDALGILSTDHFAFSFRAEEFARPHFDETLQSNQIPANAAMLGAILAGQDRKVLLVESVERLLEKATRDAFTDLLTLVAGDKSWRLVLTCRDYSADLVGKCFLESARVSHSVVTILPLDDGELEEVKGAYPTLARPLANPALRQLLRNPYIVDKALQISWSEERPLPQSEWEFRALFWQDVVRVDQCAIGGMPRRREDAFVQIALRRARALSMYVQCADFDTEVLAALRHDSLVVSSQGSGVLVAPAHDVLEDWAILQWIDEQYAMHEGSVQELSAAIGAHPAVRRTYRKWVTELVERDLAVANGLFQAAVAEGRLAAQFRDDTLVSLLRSSAAAAFLERHREELFADNKRLLRLIIRLLRVACMITPDWLETTAVSGSLFNVPDGVAWACVLRLVQGNLELFTEEDHALLLGFIEDWGKGVSLQSPYPEGAESVATIAHWLLPSFDDYRSNDQRKRTLQVIAKIPNADSVRFAALLHESGDNEERDRTAEDFQEVIFEGMEGMPVARDLPEVVVSAAKGFLLCSESELRREWASASDLELEFLFGLKHGSSGGFFPASAYRGPFLPLLRHHPWQGLSLILAVFNHSADWYAHPRVREKHVEPPFEMVLTFADGTSRTQWCNARLWNLYRGMSVGPYVLQSLLMALERWLLEFAEAYPRDLDAILLRILEGSDSAALTAVVASVATAFPHASGETLLVLLRSPLCIQLDRYRLTNESHPPSALSGLMPQLDARNKIYEEERKVADARPHRHHDLETAIAYLQLGPLASRVHEILDRHRAEVPPVEEQDEDDRMWRLAIHRMDLRQYTVSQDAVDAQVVSDPGTSAEDTRQHIRLDLKEPESDLKEMVNRSDLRFQAANASLGLLVWGMKVFDHAEDANYDSVHWRHRLQEARTIGDADSTGEKRHSGEGGPGLVAAVCIRDHWDDMSHDEQDWCVDVVCSEVEREANNWNELARVQRMSSMSSDRPCAWVLPSLVGKPLGAMRRTRVHQLLAVALTHPNDEVRWYAVQGAGRHLWEGNRELALRCVNALATETMLVQQVVDVESSRPYKERRQRNEIEAEVAVLVRRRFLETDAIANDAYLAMDTTTWFGAEANTRILAILGQAPTEAAAIAAFERQAHTFVGWWDADNDQRRSHRTERQRQPNYRAESALTDLLENFLLRTPTADAMRIIKPIVDAVDRHLDKTHWILQGLIGAEDRQPNTAQFWALWEMFAAKVRCARWLPRIDDEYASGGEMMSAVFLRSWWKEGVRHWRSLEGYAGHVHALFEDLPPSSTVLDEYLSFLYHIGEQSLPEAFLRIANRLQRGDSRQMMRKGNTVFLLETLLQRYVYGRPLELKRRSELREAVLFLLDQLVETDSSAGFRMRDDFVTPIPIA